MLKDSYQVIGVMSGTSLDGVDLAFIHFNFLADKWDFEIIQSETVSYSKDWVLKLKSAVDFSEAELLLLNREYTAYLAEIINHFVTKNKIKNLDAVCSHGHTILHQPQKGYTLQIGNLPKIAELLHQKVVCDFRVQDVELRGQGAPLVPIGDRLLFSEFDYCLNLGGFSNVSFEYENERIAFDISPVNTVLNFYANQLGLDYDDEGNIARKANLSLDLLEELNAINFYQQQFPKSLGIEFVNEVIFPTMDKYQISDADKMRTFVEHVACKIGKNIPNKKIKLLVTGGGAYNAFLIEKIKFYLNEVDVVIPSKVVIEFKEALIFGFLGVLKLRGEINTLASVTGASKDHSAGEIYNN